MDSERDILVRKRGQSGLGNDVFTVFQDLAGESPQEKSQGLLLRFAVRKSDHDHVGLLIEKLAKLYLMTRSLKTELWSKAQHISRADFRGYQFQTCCAFAISTAAVLR